MKADLTMIGISDTWYTSALHRNQWDSLYVERVPYTVVNMQLLRDTANSVQNLVIHMCMEKAFCKSSHIA